MNKFEAKQLEKKLDRLNNFIERNIGFAEEDIVSWVSACVAIFSRLKVNDTIISDFINYYTPKNVKGESIIGEGRKMGNFEKSPISYLYKKEHKSYLATIVFSTAKNILKRMEEEERLVPSWLIKELSELKIYTSIVSSLELIEKNYEDKDCDGIIKNSLTLLESILNLDDKLKKKDKLSNKIKTLISEEKIRNKFGLTKEFIFALDNARIVRNIKSVHKSKPIRYNIPFLVSVNSAYLIILLLEIVLSSGKVIDDK